MKETSRLLLFLALTVILLTAACGPDQGQSATMVAGTILPDEGLTGTPFPTDAILTVESTAETATPLGTATLAAGLETPTLGAATGAATQGAGTAATNTGVTQTPLVPVTGQDVVLVECQFCVDTLAHALLVLPDTATFQIVSPAASTTDTADTAPACTTVEVNNGRQVVLCSGPEMTPLVVNICTGASNCRDFPVDLLACPLTQGGAVSPAQTQRPGATGSTGGTGATATTVPGGVVISTATSPAASATATATP